VSAGRGNQGGRGEIGACPGLRTSRRSSPWQRARRGSDVDGEMGSGQRRVTAAALWRARSVGEVEKGVCRCANEGGKRVSEALGLKWPRAGRLRASRATWARRPRCAQLRQRLRGDEGADRGGPRAERARSGRTRWESGRADERARQDRERRGGKARARDGPVGPKGRGEQGLWATLSFSFILAIVFPFLFIYSI
jgi:hypothetical protein